MLFQPRQPPFLIVSSAIFPGSLLVALKRARLYVMRWRFRLGDEQSY